MDLSHERGDGTLFVPEKLTQQDIADRVGASREMVARILKDLTIGEYIRFEGATSSSIPGYLQSIKQAFATFQRSVLSFRNYGGESTAM